MFGNCTEILPQRHGNQSTTTSMRIHVSIATTLAAVVSTKPGFNLELDFGGSAAVTEEEEQ